MQSWPRGAFATGPLCGLSSYRRHRQETDKDRRTLSVLQVAVMTRLLLGTLMTYTRQVQCSTGPEDTCLRQSF